MLIALLKMLRPKQWTKNLIIFAGLIFSENLFNLGLLGKSILALILFCGLSGSVYIINDILDLEKDRKHPQKSKRPLPLGEVKVPFAWGFAILLALFSLFFSFLQGLNFGLIALSYFLLVTLYSLFLKNIAILDVLSISLGFVLRVVAGAVIIKVLISPWLLICTTLLALFLALAKRRHELVLLEEKAIEHRLILQEYTPRLLDQMISVVTASTLMAYSLYTIWPETVEKFKTENLLLTIPFVLYGIFRYLYLIYRKNMGGSPEIILIKDKPLIISIILWLLVVAAILYIKKGVRVIF
jgi:4-hydroxybenzoate polyprenyltransferase